MFETRWSHTTERVRNSSSIHKRNDRSDNSWDVTSVELSGFDCLESDVRQFWNLAAAGI